MGNKLVLWKQNYCILSKEHFLYKIYKMIDNFVCLSFWTPNLMLKGPEYQMENKIV